MKLLQINTVAVNGSTGRIAEQIGNFIINKGWESWIAYGRAATKSQSKLIKIGNKFDIYTHVLISKLFDNQGLSSKNATDKFIEQINQLKPDIVHIHNLHGYYINYVRLLNFLKYFKIPTVITLHDFWMITGHCAYINDSCDKWKTGCGNCNRLSADPSTLFDKSRRNWHIKSNLLNNAENIIFVPVSYWLESKISESFLSNSNIQVIQNGIDLNNFYPDKKKHPLLPQDKFIILCVATRWTDSNGFNDIIELSKRISSDEIIVIIGVNKDQQKKLPSNIIGLERTENISELRRLYSNANLFFNPNREVTFGLVTAEAMACGTPSIVYQDTAGEEIVSDPNFVISKLDEILPMIDRLKNLPSYPKDNLRYIMASKFDFNNTLKNYFELYNKLLQNTSK